MEDHDRGTRCCTLADVSLQCDMNRHWLTLLLLWVFVTACGPTSPGVRADADFNPKDGQSCTGNQTACTGQTWMRCENGQWTTVEACSNMCNDTLGCVACQPGTGTCNGDTSTVCRADGSGYWDEFCDPAMGLSCGAGGVCQGACSASALGESNVGCLYYPTAMGNWVSPDFEFAIAMANTSGAPLSVVIDGGALSAPRNVTVAANSVAIERLPWVPNLKSCNIVDLFGCGPPQPPDLSLVSTGGAYRVRSNGPLAMYQYSPLDFILGDKGSYTNDASLLLPAHVWGTSSVVASWQHWDISPGLMTVTAREANTTLTITTKATTMGAIAWPVGSTNQLVLGAGDVLQLMTEGGDLTGSLVNSDKPVQVMGGHFCTEIPNGAAACDHIEDTMLPTRALGAEYIVSAQFSPDVGTTRQQYVRVIATAPDTVVSLEPEVAPTTTLAAIGDTLYFASDQNVFVRANKKVLVANYMTGSELAPEANADPAMAVASPVAQGRTEFLFHAPTNYTSNFVNIIALAGTNVVLDGVPVAPSDFSPVGNSGYAVAHKQLSNAGNGNHSATGDQPFGILVYGYAPYTSYMYPGGTDVKTIILE